jgi:hypothetical protein
MPEDEKMTITKDIKFINEDRKEVLSDSYENCLIDTKC